MASSVSEQSHPAPMATQNLVANPSVELRHITSNANLASPNRESRLSNRTSQHLRTHRLGSRSPASIPSSPTSVHSSSSAIFERDIEPLTPSPPSLCPPDPHRMPRGKHTEQLDQSVPSVLDSAAEILTKSSPEDEDLDSVSIVAPITMDSLHSGFTSPTSRLSSRSPSPTGGAPKRRSVLLNIPSPSPSFTLPLPLQPTQAPTRRSVSPPARPTVQTTAAAVTPSTTISTPTSAYFTSHSEDSSPDTATHQEHPLHTLQTPISTSVSPSSPTHGTITTIPTSSHPPSPKHTSSKRLSFISYSDLLSSTPASTMPLSSFTLSAHANEPPPHLPSVMGFPQAHAASSSAGSIAGSSGPWSPERDLANGVDHDVGGEWEREGLGRGLEERLEALMSVPLPGKA